MMRNLLMAAVAAVTLGMMGAALASTPVVQHATSNLQARNSIVLPSQRPAYLADNKGILPRQRPAYLA